MSVGVMLNVSLMRTEHSVSSLRQPFPHLGNALASPGAFVKCSCLGLTLVSAVGLLCVGLEAT